MNNEFKERLAQHLENLLDFWWQEYRTFKKIGGQEDRESAAGALRQYRIVRRDHTELSA